MGLFVQYSNNKCVLKVPYLFSLLSFFQETDQQIEKEKENAENLKAELWKCGGGKIKIGDQKKCVTKNPTVLSPDLLMLKKLVVI